MPPEIEAALLRPHVRLRGEIDHDLFDRFEAEMNDVLDEDGPVLVELTTSGGDPDVARRVALDLKLLADRGGREVWIVGKTQVYSAGLAVLAAVPPERRLLSADCTLLIHGRRLTLTEEFDGALSEIETRLEQLLTMVRDGLRLEREGYRALAEGSALSLDDLCARAAANWYLTADEALKHGLVGAVI